MTDTASNTPAVTVEKGTSLWQDAWRRLKRNRMALISLWIIVIFSIAAILSPWLAPYPYDQIDYTLIGQAPTWAHPFGTDDLGRDLFSRVLFGLRVSIAVGVVATAVAVLIGVSWGAIAGYLGGTTDYIMMRFVDILYSLPFMFLVIILMTLFGRNLVLLFAALGGISWLTTSRIVRGQILSLKHKEFIEAARSIGAPRRVIIFRHLVPNTLGTVIIYATLLIPNIILEESFLSFLGLGVQAPMASLGSLTSDGANAMELYPWMLIYPSTILAVLLFSLNYLGDGLRDALDPRMRKD